MKVSVSSPLVSSLASLILLFVGYSSCVERSVDGTLTESKDSENGHEILKKLFERLQVKEKNSAESSKETTNEEGRIDIEKLGRTGVHKILPILQSEGRTGVAKQGLTGVDAGLEISSFEVRAGAAELGRTGVDRILPISPSRGRTGVADRGRTGVHNVLEIAEFDRMMVAKHVDKILPSNSRAGESEHDDADGLLMSGDERADLIRSLDAYIKSIRRDESR
jgi:hypothetical protein